MCTHTHTPTATATSTKPTGIITGYWWPVISLNINGLNSPIKIQRLTKWMQKQDPSFCYTQSTHLNIKDRHYIRVKGYKKIFQANGPKKQAGVAISISNKIDFKLILIKRDRKEYYILTKGKIHQDNISVFSIYGLKHKIPEFVKEILLWLKSHIDSHTLIMWTSIPQSSQ